MNRILNALREDYRNNYHLLHFFIILCCMIAAFWRLQQLSFLIGWDDQWFVLNNYTKNGLTWKNLSDIVSDFYYGQYAPINQLYYTLMHMCFGYNPLSFHVGSFLIHMVNVLLVYKFICAIGIRLTGFSELRNCQIAFFTALLFSVSPFNLEAVAWVAASKVLLYAQFYLLAMLVYIKYINTQKPVYFYLTIFCFVLSFGAKEQAVTFPAVMLLIDYVYNRDFRSHIVWYEKMPVTVLCLLFGIATLQSQGLPEEAGSHFYPIQDRILLALYTVTEYFVKNIIPINISYLYPFPFQNGQQAPLWLILYALAFPAICIIFYRSFRVKWLLFGLAFFLIHIVLVSNLFSLARHSIVADRYNYISSIGVYFLIAVVTMKFWFYKNSKKPLFTASIAYVLYFVSYTNQHSVVWENSIKLKEKLRNTIENRSDFKKWDANRK